MSDDPQQSQTKSEVQSLYEDMTSGLRKHIFGAAENGIRIELRKSKNVTRDIGSMALALVLEAASQREGGSIGTNVLVPVGVEAIDDLLEIAKAMGVIEEITDDTRKACLLVAVEDYISSTGMPREEQEAACQHAGELT